VIADGLSATAVRTHGEALVGAIVERLKGWRVAPIVVAHQARVAIGDENRRGARREPRDRAESASAPASARPTASAPISPGRHALAGGIANATASRT